jgi:hypothetical protein
VVAAGKAVTEAPAVVEAAAASAPVVTEAIAKEVTEEFQRVIRARMTISRGGRNNERWQK